MTQEELKEKRERFRLYGEICLLVDEYDDIFDYYRLERYELEDAFGKEIYVFEDAGDHGVRLDAISFDDGMLWVEYGENSVSFMCVSSETLEQIYEALKRYYKEN
jgi:hypothetical protein